MQIRFERNRTSTIVVMYFLYLYFLGLSLRNTSKALTIFKIRKEAMYPYEIGFKGLVLYRSTNVKEYLLSLLMKLLYILVGNAFGYGFVLNQYIVLSWESISQKRKT
jgi:hypothetical protein